MSENVQGSENGYAIPVGSPLPGDPLARYWVELAGNNPQLVDQIRPALVTFIGFDKDRAIVSNTSAEAGGSKGPQSPDTMVGSGFIIGGSADNGMGLVLTAKHVLEGIRAVQTPHQRHAPSALFVPPEHTQPILDPNRLKVLWMGQETSALLNVSWASSNESTDIACCIVSSQESNPSLFRPVTIPIDTQVPSVGDIVHVVSGDEMKASEIVEPTDRTGAGQIIKSSRRISIRRGTVTGVYPNGFGHYKWPCFTTTIPVKGGMSGGLAYLPRDGETIAACGIVCADLAPHESKTDQTLCGTSVIGCTWPALALQLPEEIPAPKNAFTRSLLEMVQLGRVTMPIGGVSEFRLESLENGDFRLHRG